MFLFATILSITLTPDTSGQQSLHYFELSLTLKNLLIYFYSHLLFLTRLFTDIPLSAFELPSPEYHHCQKCQVWRHVSNIHCDKCGTCPSKDGKTYVHCTICKRCLFLNLSSKLLRELNEITLFTL